MEGEFMMTDKILKLKLVKIWEILSQETDEENPMGTTELLQKLNSIGIDCDRRTLYADIDALNECGYEILCRRSKSNMYYVKDRKFSIAEIRTMMDAVQAAGFITDKQTEVFVEKLAFLAGSRRGEALKDNIVAFNDTKTDNPTIYANVEIITEAIQNNKKVKFTYFDFDNNHKRVYRKEGKFYYINPYALVMDNDNYYFLGYDMFHNNMMHYRVDRMDSVQVSRHDKEELKEFEKFDIKKHKKQLFGMYGGEGQEVRFRVDKSLIDVVFDVFGVDTKFTVLNDGMYEFKAEVQLSPQFYGWCCSFGDKLKVISPIMVVNLLQDYINNLSNNYKG